MSPEQLFTNARDAHQAGHLAEAEAQYRKLLALYPDHPDVNHMLGILCGQTGRGEESVGLIRNSVKAMPGNAQFHFNLGNALVQTGAWEPAATAFKKSIELEPKNADAHFNIGLAMIKLARPDSAISSFRRALRFNPDFPPALAELANCLGAGGNFTEAIELQQRAIALAPGHASFWSTLGLLKLKALDWAGAIEAFDQALSIEQWNVPALANKSVALFEAGRDDEASAIVDLDNLFDIGTLPLPESIDRQTLGDRLENHQSCVWDRTDITTKAGAQTGNLTGDNDPAISEFVGILSDYVSAFIESQTPAASCPFKARIPSKWDLRVWATILLEDGHQDPHLHPAGWLSGVFYLDVPEHVSASKNIDHEGWIEFGKPGYGIAPVRQSVVREIMPELDKIVLFPSYLYHRTIPLIGTERRISIAFDVIPKEWRD